MTEAPAKPRGLLMPLYNAAAMAALHQAVADLVAKDFVRDTDFGKIPGTGKDTLHKPGAEKALVWFGVSVRYEIIESEIDHDREVRWTKTYKAKGNRPAATKAGVSFGLYRYVIRAIVYRLDTAEVVGEGLGSCSTMESKYVDRPRDSENTALKIGKKRAMVDAALSTFGLSDRFTQDVEDLKANGVIGDPEEEEPKIEPITTLEQAKALIIPGGPTKFDGFGGKPFGEATAKVLKALYKWADGIISKAGSEGVEADQQVVNYKVAAEMILKANTPPPAEGAAPAETKPAPAAAPAKKEKPAGKHGVGPGEETDCCEVAKSSEGLDHSPDCKNFIDDDLPF